MFISIVFSMLAGMVTVLNPCVLPLLPVVLGTALNEHRAGPIALLAGLVVSFSSLGFLVVVFGQQIGIDEQVVRMAGGALLVVAGAVLFVPQWQGALSAAGGAIVSPAQNTLSRVGGQGLFGQFIVGMLLGIVWSPCVGPTLGAAIASASQGQNLGQVFITFLSFSAGIAIVLLGLAYGSRRALSARMMQLRGSSLQLRRGFAVIMVATGASVVLGFDKMIETVLVNLMPDWLIAFSSQF